MVFFFKKKTIFAHEQAEEIAKGPIVKASYLQEDLTTAGVIDRSDAPANIPPASGVGARTTAQQTKMGIQVVSCIIYKFIDWRTMDTSWQLLC